MMEKFTINNMLNVTCILNDSFLSHLYCADA